MFARLSCARVPSTCLDPLDLLFCFSPSYLLPSPPPILPLALCSVSYQAYADIEGNFTMPPARAFARPSSAQSLGFSASGVIHVVQNLRPADVTVSTSASQVVVPCPQACPVGSMCDLVLGDCVHDIATCFSVVNFRHFLYVD
jgi:hypothetical protein